MKPLSLLALLLCILITACSSHIPQTSQSSEFSQVLSVKIDAGANQSDLEAQYGGKVIVWRPESNLAILGLYGGDLTAQDVVDAYKTPEVSTLSIYNNGYKTWGGGYRAWSGGYKAWGGGTSSFPTTFDENVPLWNIVKLVPGQNLAPNLGRAVKVAVIDSGIDTAHPAFVGKLAPSTEWKDFVDGDSNPQEVSGGKGYGHGTSVAGVILQVAPNAVILPVRVLDSDGAGDLDKVVMAVDWAIAKGAKIIHLSLGTDVDYASFNDIVRVANSRGIPVVASSGNNGSKGMEYPSRFKSLAIGIGSVAASGSQSVFSAYGPELDAMAPGEFIYSAYPAGQVAYSSGTSFAAPVVTGTFALALGQKAVTLQKLEQSLASSSVKVGSNPKGTLQVDAFLRLALQ